MSNFFAASCFLSVSFSSLVCFTCSEDQEINEKFAAFANLYERKKNQRKIDIAARDFKSYKAFHLLFSGTYNLPSANLHASEASRDPNLSLVHEEDSGNQEEAIPERETKRKLRRRKLLKSFDNINGSNHPHNTLRGNVYRKNSSYAIHDIKLKALANNVAGSLLRKNSTKLPVIPKNFVSPLKRHKKSSFTTTKSKALLYPSLVSSAASSMRSEKTNESFISPPVSRSFSTRGSSKYHISTRGSNKMRMKYKMSASTNLHRRTRAVIGRRIRLPEPPFPISTW